MSTRVDQLDQLRHEVNLNLAFGAVSDIDLVTNDEGHCPVVVALDSEPLSAILADCAPSAVTAPCSPAAKRAYVPCRCFTTSARSPAGRLADTGS